MNEIISKGSVKMNWNINTTRASRFRSIHNSLNVKPNRHGRETAKSWLNVAYGSSPREMLDIYAADKPGGPVLIYIHGGYWRGGH